MQILMKDIIKRKEIESILVSILLIALSVFLIMRKWKYIIISIAIIVTSLLIVKVKNASADVMEYMPVSNKIVVLDAGHGGIDPGAMNKDKTILEKDINLEITKKLRDLIEASGGTVIMTRDKDVSLYEEDGNKTTRQKYNENLRNRKKIIDVSLLFLII